MIHQTAVLGLMAAGSLTSVEAFGFSSFKSGSNPPSTPQTTLTLGNFSPSTTIDNTPAPPPAPVEEEPVCGRFYPDTQLDSNKFKDVQAATEQACLEACYAKAACDAVSWRGNRCWMQNEVVEFQPDTTGKSSYILCEGERETLGDDDNEGNEGNEGDEGDEGGFTSSSGGSTGSTASCTASSSAVAFTASKDAYILALAESYDLVCDPEREDQIDPMDVEIIWDIPAYAVAQAITDASGDCTSSGTAFGCAKAEAQAAAWALATAEAHAAAYAEAYNGCGNCDPDTALEATASAEVIASTFVELMADVYSRSEIQVCVAGNQAASANAWSNCFAKAFARINAKAVADSLVAGACQYAQAEVFVRAATDATYTNVAGCEQGDSGSGNGSGSTSGSGAEATVIDH